MADSSKENTEAIVDTIKSELAIGFKNCIDKIDTEKKWLIDTIGKFM